MRPAVWGQGSWMDTGQLRLQPSRSQESEGGAVSDLASAERCSELTRVESWCVVLATYRRQEQGKWRCARAGCRIHSQERGEPRAGQAFPSRPRLKKADLTPDAHTRVGQEEGRPTDTHTHNLCHTERCSITLSHYFPLVFQCCRVSRYTPARNYCEINSENLISCN